MTDGPYRTAGPRERQLEPFVVFFSYHDTTGRPFSSVKWVWAKDKLEAINDARGDTKMMSIWICDAVCLDDFYDMMQNPPKKES